MRFDQLKRREFITLVGSAVASWPLAARAQQRAMPVIGFLHSASRAPNAHLVAAFRKGLSEAGFVEGQNVAIEYRWAEGQYDRLPRMARELIDGKVDIMVTVTTPAALAAKQATSVLPIVFVEVGNPILVGLVGSLSRPEANITGFSNMASDLSDKRFALLKEAIPHARRIAVLWNPNNPTTAPKLQATEAAARSFDITVSRHSVQDVDELEASFGAILAAGADALIALLDTVVLDNRERVVTFAAASKLPAIYEAREFVQSGGLMSYGTNFADHFENAAGYVGKILRGTKPGALPVQQPTKFELVINLKTAKLLGIEPPPTLVALADEVIE
jgi:putative tryptophan/tyrosine transport system substrate-binding protein